MKSPLPSVRSVLQAVGASYRANRRFLNRAFLSAIVVCLALVGVALATGRPSGFFYSEYKEDGSRFCGLLTLASSFCMLAGGLLVLLGGRQVSRLSGMKDRAIRWHVTGLGVMYLGLDDLLMFHEWITTRIRVRLGFGRVLGLDWDVYIYAVYGLVALLVGLWILPEIVRYRSCAFPVCVLVVSMAFAQLVDVKFAWHELSPLAQQWEDPIEEIPKTLGAWSALLWGVLFLEELVELRVASGRTGDHAG